MRRPAFKTRACPARRLLGGLLVFLSLASAAQALAQPRTLSLPARLNEVEIGLIEVDISSPADPAIPLAALEALIAPHADDTLRLALLGLEAGGYTPISRITGIDGLIVRFDMLTAEVRVEIAPERLNPISISLARQRAEPAAPLPPARRSAFLNLFLRSSYAEGGAGSDLTHILNLQGAARISRGGGWALVYEGDLDESRPAGDRFRRGDLTLRHDDVERAIRWSIGDVNVRSDSFQSGTPLLGLAAERRYDAIQPTRNTRPGGRFEFSLQRAALVEVYLNGALLRTIRLGAGRYDVRDFSFFNGANRIELVIEGPDGRRDRLDFSVYSDSTLLAAGLSEFSFALGLPARRDAAGTSYEDGRPVLTAARRWGASDTLTLSLSGQADPDTAQAGGGAVWANRHGVLRLNAAMSYSQAARAWDGAAIASFRLNPEQLPLDGAQLEFGADYTGANFARIDDPTPLNASAGGLNARFSAPLPAEIHMTAGARYGFGRRGRADNWSASFSLSRGFGPVSSFLTFNATQRPETDDTEFSALISFTRRLGRNRNMSVRHDTLTRSTIAEISQTSPDRPGAFGWSAGIENRPGGLDLTGGARYAGNRFEADFQHVVVTEDEGSGGRRTSRLGLAASIAFADGAVAVGRPVGDAFAIVTRHESLGDRTVRIGEYGAERARSDALGAPLFNELGVYRAETLAVSVDDPPPGYFLGPGEYAVAPPPLAGYRIEIGSDASQTVRGLLYLPDGELAALLGGELAPLDGQAAPPVAVFTNRNGRFFASGLAPGRYRLSLPSGPGYQGEIRIPGGEGVTDIGAVNLREMETPR